MENVVAVLIEVVGGKLCQEAMEQDQKEKVLAQVEVWEKPAEIIWAAELENPEELPVEEIQEEKIPVKVLVGIETEVNFF